MTKSCYEIISQYSEDIGKTYPQLCGNPFVAAQYETPLRIIRKYGPQEQSLSKVLDWGCGTGHFSYLLMELGFDTYGYSYTPADLTKSIPIKNLLKKRHDRDWKVIHSDCKDPVKLPYENESFDALVSLGVLEHVRETNGNELESLQELYRILKPGGQLFVFHFPNKLSWIEGTIRTLKKWGMINKYSHQFLYRKKDIENFVKQTNFTLLETGIYNLFPRMIWRFLPKAISHNRLAYKTLQSLEKGLGLFLKEFSQNYFFVLKK